MRPQGNHVGKVRNVRQTSAKRTSVTKDTKTPLFRKRITRPARTASVQRPQPRPNHRFETYFRRNAREFPQRQRKIGKTLRSTFYVRHKQVQGKRGNVPCLRGWARPFINVGVHRPSTTITTTKHHGMSLTGSLQQRERSPSPGAATTTQAPSFKFDVRYTNDGRPVRVTMFPMLLGNTRDTETDETLIREVAADIFRARILKEVQLFRPGMSQEQADEAVTGLLQLGDSAEDQYTANTHNLKLKDVKRPAFDELMAKVAYKNVTWRTTSWTYYIDPKVFFFGSGGRSKKKIPGVRNHSLQSYEHEGQPVSCAALPILLHMIHHSPDEYPSGRKMVSAARFQRVVRLAFELQQKLGWEAEVSMADLGAFVKHPDYTTYRLVMIVPPIKDMTYFSWIGEDYVFDDSVDVDPKIVYIHLTDDNHYCRSHTRTFISHQRGSTIERGCGVSDAL
ncbi:hypothetical protein BC832DRAFT_542582 [Gaertneriomyces semiglobifer]|nr:hypothetical protein BC832DRAFT_542582 [Gaertneriomyces semiglobifer]